ncbi:MAG: MaoC family dehydratase [Novosphingobium meiothermophilum]|uniref:MaoC family dehydratase n=1 Tax=Novosphingobium TaxID=165696 RepID=UPI000D6E0498|nr:MaoC family dehydratase [Novosphingobium sp.]
MDAVTVTTGSAAIFEKPSDLLGREGTMLGPTDWLLIDQARVNGFADVTGDHQWIHVDVERAQAGPFGGTIAHGYLTMSLVNFFLPQLIEVRGFAHAVNVGADRLRFLAPVKVGSRIRARGEIISAEEVKGAIQSVVRVTVEIEGQDKPACVLDTISRYFPE